MRIAIAGSSGLIGSALSASLFADGHDVLALVRRPPRSHNELQWDPRTEDLDANALRGVDAIVNLAGAGLGDRRWNAEYRGVILGSRVDATRTLARAAATAQVPVLVNGSAIGFYGDTGDTVVDERSPRGNGFLAEVVEAWEQATAAAADAGVRVVLARTGLVMTQGGGAMQRMLPLFKLGLGGPLGSGRQYWSSISLHDEVRALRFCIEQPLHGPVNLTAPNPVTNKEFTRALARALRRPALLPVPAAALRLVIGEFAGDILGSQRVVPSQLLQAGFTFTHADVDAITSTLR